MEGGRGYSDKDMAEVSELARSKSFAEAFPDLAASLKGVVTVESIGMTRSYDGLALRPID